jgi:hypothetical protein
VEEGEVPSRKPEAFLVDLDGTLALHAGVRNPYEWRHAGADLPNSAVVRVVQALHRDGLSIVYISGRPESARSITFDWVERHVGVKGQLHLRSDGDRRKDAVIKRELYMTKIKPTFSVVGVFDDRQQVVDMWRLELGLPCFQVAPGEF